METKLCIVESPTKEKTIKKYLGKEYQVMACNGHIRNLPTNKLGIEIEKDFTPHYIIIPKKKKIVNSLKEATKGKQEILLATDCDREGEAIASHLLHALNLKDNDSRVKRIIFNEITADAINKALENPTDINKDLVKAQEVRRIYDRILGYHLSLILWKKVKFGSSTGRVKAIAGKFLVDRERDIRNFVPVSFFQIKAEFKTESGKVLTTVSKKKIAPEKVEHFMLLCQKSTFFIKSISKKIAYQHPPAPFTTSSLQQEAFCKLGFSIRKTMILAQELYEEGSITYMRTDSTRFSKKALKESKNTIITSFGEKFYKKREYISKKKHIQEAHEAIRPSYFDKSSLEEDNLHKKKLYSLIWKRSVASQMIAAQLEKCRVLVNSNNEDLSFEKKGDIVLNPGFLILEGKMEQKEYLPFLKEGMKFNLEKVYALERLTKPAPRYTEATLVKSLEEAGIGRPSTYSPIISAIQERGSVVKGNMEGFPQKYISIEATKDSITRGEKVENRGSTKGKLLPTSLAMAIQKFLTRFFPYIVDVNFTSKKEEELDDIVRQKKNSLDVLKKFYIPFKEDITKASEEKRVPDVRLLGQDPVTKEPIYVRFSRKKGALLQKGDFSKDGSSKPVFANLGAEQSMDYITLEEALQRFIMPKFLGLYEKEEVFVNIGKFGPYIRYKNLFCSIEDMDPYSIYLEEAIKYIEKKKEKDAKNLLFIFQGEPVFKIFKGRFSNYLQAGQEKVYFPKDQNMESLTRELCEQYWEKRKKKKKRNTKKQKKSK